MPEAAPPAAPHVAEPPAPWPAVAQAGSPGPVLTEVCAVLARLADLPPDPTERLGLRRILST